MSNLSKTGGKDILHVGESRGVAAVIPALNEADSIENVVRQVLQRAQAIVVDDGSTDGTAERAKNAGAYVVKHSKNKGYDGALETGICTAIELGFKHAITLDADGQHDPELLNLFYEEFNKGADLVVGVRDRTQRWSEEIFCIVGRRMWGLHDPLCGMKGYRLSKLVENKSINTYPSVGTELAIRLINNGIIPHQIPVKTYPRNGMSRFGSGIIVNIKILKALIFGIKLKIK